MDFFMGKSTENSLSFSQHTIACWNIVLGFIMLLAVVGCIKNMMMLEEDKLDIA
jgi:hypothetical protein